MMRTMIAVGALALLGAGCGGDASVSLTFSGSNAMPSPGAGMMSATTTSTMDSLGLHLTATAGTARLDVTIDPPPPSPATVAIGERHLDISYQLGNDGWGSNDGSVDFTSVSPYTIKFNHVAMLSAAGSASGGFYLDGTATFK